MTISLKVTQLSNTQVQLVWTSTDADPAAGWKIDREVNPPDTPKVLTSDLIGDNKVFVDDVSVEVFDVGDIIDYIVTDNDTATFGQTQLTWADLEVPFTYGKIDPLEDTIRYASLDSVKQRLGFNTAEWDTELTQAIIAGEVAIDISMGRSFPDTGSNPQVVGIPEQIKQASENIGVKIFKTLDAPFGTAGAEGFLGELDLTEMVRREIIFNPLISGYQIAWGVA